jgi:hypothetical protein
MEFAAAATVTLLPTPNSFSTTVTSYNPTRYEDVSSTKNSKTVRSHCEYTPPTSQYGAFYGIQRKPISLKRGSKKTNSGKFVGKYERDPLFINHDQRVTRKEEDAYWPEYFRQKESNFLAARAGGSDPILNRNKKNKMKIGSKSGSSAAESNEKLITTSSSWTTDTQQNVLVNAQSLALKDQTKRHTYQFGVTYEEWETKKSKEIAKKKAIAKKKHEKKLELEKRRKAKKIEDESKSFNDWKTKYDHRRRQERLKKQAKEKEEKENELRRKAQNERDNARMMRKVKRDRLIMLMTKKDIETKQKAKDVTTTNYLLASRAKLINDTPSEIEMWKKRKKREAIERKKLDKERLKKEKLLKEKMRRDKWKKNDIVLAYAKQ